jgi:hypothetical protein
MAAAAVAAAAATMAAAVVVNMSSAFKSGTQHKQTEKPKPTEPVDRISDMPPNGKYFHFPNKSRTKRKIMEFPSGCY